MPGAVSVPSLKKAATFPLRLRPTPTSPGSPFPPAPNLLPLAPPLTPTPAHAQGNSRLSTYLRAPGPWRVRRGPSYLTPTRHKEPPKELESASSDEENEDGDFTVYECPGLAPVSALGVWTGLPALGRLLTWLSQALLPGA